MSDEASANPRRTQEKALYPLSEIVVSNASNAESDISHYEQLVRLIEAKGKQS